MPLLGGDRRASRAELRKLALYAHGQERVELDDVMAVVADASALALDSLVDAAFAGNVADVEKEFAKATIAGTNPSAIVGAALRQVERLHALWLEVESGRQPRRWSSVRSPAFISAASRYREALQRWTSERLARRWRCWRSLARRAAQSDLARRSRSAP